MEGGQIEMDVNQGSTGFNNPPAVYVRRAYKQYGKLNVLRNLNMTVKQGSVYGLLGSSGAGKTTLLTCIVGQKMLDAGEIRVVGVTPGRRSDGVPGVKIGYMPQDIALYPNFTINNTMLYFGWILNVPTSEIEEKLDFLTKLLDLPHRNKIVKNMSGGQQRRLSLAVALLHDPEVVILDEPTVGVDPLLRQVIWDHLLHIAGRGGKTIIVTTHYIEEARQAGTIGLMRNGCLLEEASPNTLLEKYSCDNLEQAFLYLSEEQEKRTGSLTILRRQENENVNRENSYSVTSEEYLESSVPDQKKGCSERQNDKPKKGQWMGPMRALLYKNSLSIIRDPSLVVFVFGQAVMLTAICHLVLGNSPNNLLLAVVNHDGTSARADCEGAAPLHGNCSLGDLACQFLLRVREPYLRKCVDGRLPNVVVHCYKEFYDHLDSAKNAVRKGRAWGVLYISQNFTYAVVQRKEEGRNVDDRVLEDSFIHIWMDMSNQIVSWMVYEELKMKYLDFARSIFAACDYNPKLADIPLKTQPVYGTMTPSFINFAAPGLLLFMVFFFGVASSVLSIVYERREGLLDRNFVSGVTMVEVMAAHFLAQLFLMVGEVILLITFGFYVFHFECVGSMAYVFAIVMLQGICGMCYGFVVSSVCKNEGAAFYFASASMQPMLFLCGILWPLEGMSVVIRWLSELMPLTYPIKTLRSVMLRGWGLDYSEVSAGFGISVLWILLYLAVTLTASKMLRL